MLTKKIAVVLTAAAMSAPAFADRGHYENRGHGYGYGRPVVVHKSYYVRPAPRPVYVVHPAPQPVVYHSHSNVAPALIFGAVLGAVIAGSVAASR